MYNTENGTGDTKRIGSEKTKRKSYTKVGTDYSERSEKGILKRHQSNNKKPKNVGAIWQHRDNTLLNITR
jgi:hypothetical protein